MVAGISYLRTFSTAKKHDDAMLWYSMLHTLSMALVIVKEPAEPYGGRGRDSVDQTDD